MKVSSFPCDPGASGWNAILPKQSRYTELAESLSCDWLVIGAGFAGLAAARRLQQICPGDRIVILEATQVSQGPAGRNSGFMIDLPHDLSSKNYINNADSDVEQIKLNRGAIEFSRQMVEEFGLDDEAFILSGKTNAAATQKGAQHNNDYADYLVALGEPHELLDAKAMKELTGSDYYMSGLYTPGTAMLQPAKFIQGVAKVLSDLGVELFENSPVIELERRGAGWTATTPKGKVTTPKVILAVNGHAESFGFYKRQLLHVFLYASMTRRLEATEVQHLGGAQAWGLTPSDPFGSTVRRISGTGGDRIIIRNRVTYDPSLQVNHSRPQDFAGFHDKTFANRFPALKNIKMEYRWGGRLCLSWNNVPAFGEVDNNVYSACCQNGLGLTQGTLSGMMAADLATGNKSKFLEIMENQKQPTILPPKPLSWIGVNARLRWGEFKAGKEL
ncbi:MAG: FAD-binding oxidoreductase [Rhizobiaceae bacterium]